MHFKSTNHFDIKSDKLGQNHLKMNVMKASKQLVNSCLIIEIIIKIIKLLIINSSQNKFASQ